MLKKINIFEKIFKGYTYNLDILNSNASANNNIALIKYWGKESEELMIPSTSSLSFCLENFYGTKVEVKKNLQSKKDILIINNQIIKTNAPEYKRFYDFLYNIKRVNKKFSDIRIKQEFFIVLTQANIPIAAGLASSASFFAALTKAFFNFYVKNETNEYEEIIHKSIIARTGSVSASRSVFEPKNGEFILLNKYKENSFSYPIKHYFDDLYCGIVLIDENEKKIKSSDAMRISVKNKNYLKWVKRTNEDLTAIQKAIKNINLKDFFKITMENSEMLSEFLKEDGVNYDLPKTIEIKAMIKEEFKNNNLITFTQDAGPNLKVISNKKEVIEDLFKKQKLIISKIL